jgi:hypothetical protein
VCSVTSQGHQTPREPRVREVGHSSTPSTRPLSSPSSEPSPPSYRSATTQYPLRLETSITLLRNPHTQVTSPPNQDNGQPLQQRTRPLLTTRPAPRRSTHHTHHRLRPRLRRRQHPQVPRQESRRTTPDAGRSRSRRPSIIIISIRGWRSRRRRRPGTSSCRRRGMSFPFAHSIP